MKNQELNNKNVLSKESQLELFKQYKKTLDINIRNKIVENNLDLVNIIVKYYLIEDFYKKEELLSYAYEGLILAVENYDPSLKIEFKIFACKYIKYKILTSLPYLSDFKRGQFFTNFIKVKTIVENESCKKLSDNVELVDEILNCMIENKMIDKNYYLDHRDKILITLPIYFNH